MNFAFGLSLLLWIPSAVAQEPGACEDRVPAPRLEIYPPATRDSLEEAYLGAIEDCSDASRVGRLAMLAHAFEEHALAAQVYRLAAELDPEDFRWRYLGGLAMWRAGDRQGALEYLSAGARLAPDYLPARLSLGEFQLESGDSSGALVHFEEALERDPENAEALYGSGRALAGLGRADDAEIRYRRALRIFPEFGPALYSLALLLRSAGAESESLQLLQQYRLHSNRWPARQDPLLDEVNSLKARPADFLRTGVRLAEAGRTEEAVRLHLEALDRDPSLVQAHVNLIQLYATVGEISEAIRHYEVALELEPDRFDAHYNFGVLQLQQGDFQKAAEAFRSVLKVNPHHFGALNNLGSIRMNEGRLEEAAAKFRLALSSAPEHHGARFNYARALAALGRLDQAVEQMDILLRGLEPGAPEEARYRYALGALLVRQGELVRGRELLQRALEMASANEDAELRASIQRDLDSLEAMTARQGGGP